MKVDVVGRVQNIDLPKSKALQPLFDAIVNSFHAIDERGEMDNGTINIYFERHDNIQPLLTGEIEAGPIKNIIIEDNGVGFNDSNFNSFKTSDTTKKKDIGGKGVGRFLWLKAFEQVEIDSVYKIGDCYYERKFEFKLSEDAVNEKYTGKADATEQKTKIKLKGLKIFYEESWPKSLDIIASRIIEHCISFFSLQNNTTTVRITDMFDSKFINLNEKYLAEIDSKRTEKEVEVAGNKFKLLILKLRSCQEYEHTLFLCAHRREVTRTKLSKLIPIMNVKIRDEEGKPFVCLAYVSGDYLDESVNQERTNFHIPSTSENETLFKEITIKEINNSVVKEINETLGDYLRPAKEEELKHIESYVQGQRPEWKYILKHRREEIEKIAPGLTHEKLDIELFKIENDVELERRKDLQKVKETNFSSEEELKRYYELVTLENDISKAKLTKYVIHRRVMLELLEKNLEKGGYEEYEFEKRVHSIFFPMRTTSDDSFYRDQNLWIIDEKLSYHYYLASDKPLNQLVPIECTSIKRPDIIIFDVTFGFAPQNAPYPSIVLIEFKRPGKQHYEEDPIDQVFQYIRKIREGKVTTEKGRPFDFPQNNPFYIYLICDIVPYIKERAEFRGFYKTADGLGYFWFNHQLTAYLEIISYNKLLNDSKQRNRILFEKLNIPVNFC